MTLAPNPAPDLALARRFVAAHPNPGEVLMVGVTGSHIYGFSSPDSDIDLKGIHQVPTRAMLGFGKPRETFDRLEFFEGVECDLTTHELKKALELMLNGNGNMLERIESPIQLYETEALAELRALSRGARSARYIRHYSGFFKGMCREHGKSSAPKAKTLLYAYRVALTGVHLLLTGELQPDLRALAPAYGFPEAMDLIAYKAEHAEKAIVPPEMDAAHRENWPKLDAMLFDAKARTALPPEAPNRDECEAWLIERRTRA